MKNIVIVLNSTIIQKYKFLYKIYNNKIQNAYSLFQILEILFTPIRILFKNPIYIN